MAHNMSLEELMQAMQMGREEKDPFDRYKSMEMHQIGTDHRIQVNILPEDQVDRQESLALRAHFTQIISDRGYDMDWRTAIAVGEDNAFDHSVWRISKKVPEAAWVQQAFIGGADSWAQQIVGAQSWQQGAAGASGGAPAPPQVPPLEYYALKIVSLQYYKIRAMTQLTVAESVASIRKEADLLLRINHANVVKVIMIILLPDRGTNFEYPYLGIVMELMEGTIPDLMKTRFPNGLPSIYNKYWFRDIGLALVHLHYYLTETKHPFRPIHLVHNAVFIRNILYKNVSPNLIIFKLGDFEESESHLAGQAPDRWWVSDVIQLARALYYSLQPTNSHTLAGQLIYRITGRDLPNEPVPIGYPSMGQTPVPSMYEAVQASHTWLQSQE